MCTNSGQYFGDIIWCIVSVNVNGLLSLTQRMSSINVLGSTAKPNDNNFNNDSLNNSNNLQNPFEVSSSMRNHNNLVQRIKDSEMQIDEDNKN